MSVPNQLLKPLPPPFLSISFLLGTNSSQETNSITPGSPKTGGKGREQAHILGTADPVSQMFYLQPASHAVKQLTFSVCY